MGRKAVQLANAILGLAVAASALDLFFAVQLGRPLLLKILPAVFIVVFLALMRFVRAHRIEIAVVTLVAGLMMIGAELWLASFYMPPGTAADKAGRNYDGRTISEVMRDLRLTNASPCPPLSPGALMQAGVFSISVDGGALLPLAGISNCSTIWGNESGKYQISESDEHGFGNPKGLWGSGPVEIAVVGDSFAEGAYVDPETNLVALLRRRYPTTLKIAKSANGPLLEYAGIREYLTSVRPKVVLWCYHDNDFGDLNLEKSNPLLMRYLERSFSQDLIHRQPVIDKALTAVYARLATEELERAKWPGTLARLGLSEEGSPLWVHDLVLKRADSTLAQVIRFDHVNTRIEALLNRAAAPQPDVELFEKILAGARDEVSSWGGKLYVVYLPGWGTLRFKWRAARFARSTISDVTKRLGLPLIDLYPRLMEEPNLSSLFYFSYSHYNERGYRIVGDEVLKSLEQSYGRPPGGHLMMTKASRAK